MSAIVLAGCPDRWVDFRIHRFISAEVGKVDGAGFQMNLRCEVENKNALGAELWDLRYRATVGGHELGRGETRGLLKKVAARSRFELVVPVRVSYGHLPSDLPQRTKRGALGMKTEVWFTAKTHLGGSFRMHLVSRDQVRIDRALRAAVRGSFSGEALRISRIAFRGLGLRETKLSLRARVKNLFPFPVRIAGARYRLSINERPFGKGRLGAPIALAPGAMREIELPLSAPHGALGRAIGALATTNPRFRVRGEVTISPPLAGITKLPLDVTADSSVFADAPP